MRASIFSMPELYQNLFDCRVNSRDAPGEVLDGHAFEGRKGLLQWYEASVGYNPDAAREKPMPILDLLDLVASMLLLYEWDRTTANS